jgi:hypothetical protein
MILRALGQHWPARKIEWIMAGLTATWGGYILLHPEIFTQPETAEILSGMIVMAQTYGIAPENFWGGGALLMGLIRAIALFINGAYVRTPLFRALAAFGTMFIFTQVSIALHRSGVPNFGLVVYPWLVFADLLSAYRAAQDAVYAEVQRRSQKEAAGADYPCLRAA